MTPLMPDLRTIAEAEQPVIPVDLRVTWVEDIKGRSALRVQPLKPEFEVDDDWVVVLEDIEFGNGTIEFDALGQSEPPQSNFLGVAFRYVDETTHDAVYLRPFNFRASDPERRSHAVQYISHPDHHWFDLREQHPLRYEQPITPAPDGDEWFHVRVEVERPRIRVFINGAPVPSLDVEELSDRASGGLGIWVGPGQGGHFANFVITAVAATMQPEGT
jgi:hypothetical protein